LSDIFITSLFSDPEYFWCVTLAVIPSICLHEYFHAQVAFWCGDDTAAHYGHLTLNPLRQMGWISLVMFFILGIAWGMVPVDRRRLSKGQAALVSFSGPGMNLLLAALAWIACVFMPLWTANGGPRLLHVYLIVLGMYNLVLFFINMLPVPGLDGWGILSEFFHFRAVNSEVVKGAMLFLMLGIFVCIDYVFAAAMWVMSLAQLPALR
jgi:peptidase M50